MAHGSILQILVIEEEEGKKVNPATGKPNKWKVARGCVLDDAGEVVTVGRFRVPRAMEETIAKGTFRCAFALGVPDWGDDKGDIAAVITALSPVRAAAPQPAGKGA
ncbi:hypothetical protein [Variovorax sp.]|uniref:hypothetical protein n=1 Tax=Variovorax sp. TaxID=1871043 RepID=UPI002D2DC1A0|nr:hypothetical protein [Variovorax sp.]HYP84393.1 hypothetical protein [Variovorax sp.]